MNMLRLRFFNEAHPRRKNGAAPHSTTTLASVSCSHVEARIGSGSHPVSSTPIVSASSGADSAAQIHIRWLMSASSGLGPSSSVGASGSSAIPQIGQSPGPSRRISGCIGHVHTAPSGAVAGGASWLWP